MTPVRPNAILLALPSGRLYDEVGGVTRPFGKKPAGEKMSENQGKKRTGKTIQNVGAFLGVIVSLSVMFGIGMTGAIPGAIFGAIGAVVGSLAAMPIAAIFATED